MLHDKVLVLLALAASACAAAPAFADAPSPPPCGTKGEASWRASLNTGAVTVVTKGQDRDFATAGFEICGAVRKGLQLQVGAQLIGEQDGGGLNFRKPETFRAVTPEARLSYEIGEGQFVLSGYGAVTLSVEGLQGAPVDPRLITAQLEARGKLKGLIVRLRGGHDGTVGGWALGGGIEIPIDGAPSLVSEYAYPLTQANPSLPLPWVVTAGARVRFGTWRLKGLFQ